MNFECNFETSSDYIRVVEIHNKTLFRKVFNALTEGKSLDDEEEPYVLVNDENHTLHGDNIICVTDVKNFNMDNKSIVSAVNERVRMFVNSDEIVSEKFQKLSYEMLSLIRVISDEFECDFFVKDQELDILKILKLYGFSTCDDQADWFEKLQNIITLYADLLPKKILCFFNVKEWLNTEETDIFYNHIVNQKINVILFESVECNNTFQKERKIIIDDNFDEIVVNN